MREHDAANLLLISFDQWRGDWADPLKPVVDLPSMRQLSEEGWTARRCYTSSPHCVPARFSWLTGLAPSQLGVTKNMVASLPPDAPSIVRDLRQQGWHTALVGKTHWTSHANAVDLRNNLSLLHALGFHQAIEVAGPRALRRVRCELTDAWERAGVLELQRADLEARYGGGRNPAAWTVRPSLLPNKLYPDLWITKKALELLAHMPENQPWFLWVSFVGPHEPFDTPKPWHGRHKDAELPLPAPAAAWIRELPEDCELRRTAESWEGLISPKAIMKVRADYADHLQLLDDQIATLLNNLAKRSDNVKTGVAVCADHGELLGDHEMLYKGAFLEGAIRVPWIYRAPATAIGEDTQRDKLTNKPIPLTGLLQQTLANLCSGGRTEPLVNWAQQQQGAVVEFDSEVLMIIGNRKLAVDKDGRPLWAINLDRDPQEQENHVMSRARRWRLSPKWHQIRKHTRNVIRVRSTENWIWRQLGSNG